MKRCEHVKSGEFRAFATVRADTLPGRDYHGERLNQVLIQVGVVCPLCATRISTIITQLTADAAEQA